MATIVEVWQLTYSINEAKPTKRLCQLGVGSRNNGNFITYCRFFSVNNQRPSWKIVAILKALEANMRYQYSNPYRTCVPTLELVITCVGFLSATAVFPNHHWRPSWKKDAILKVLEAYMFYLYSRTHGTCVPNYVFELRTVGNLSSNTVFSQ